MSERICQEKAWKPSHHFLKNGSAKFFCPIINKENSVFWSFTRIRLGKYPISFIQCKMSGFSTNSCGYGSSILINNALIASFAEAWERLWMLFLTSDNNTQFGKFTSSNGFAAGATEKLAITSSRYELIERYLFLRAWHEMKGWQKYSANGFKSRFLSLILSANNWHLNLYKISDNNLGSTLAGLAYNKQFGAIFDCIYLQDKNKFKKNESKLLSSLIRSAALQSKYPLDMNWNLPEKGQPIDHSKFYRNPENSKAFDFLKNIESQKKNFIFMSEYDNIKSKLILDVTNFPAVAVSYNDDWPELRWGTRSIMGENPWPHPLA